MKTYHRIPSHPVLLSTESTGECVVGGCGKAAYPYTDRALLPEGYVDTCRYHAPQAIRDAAKSINEAPAGCAAELLHLRGGINAGLRCGDVQRGKVVYCSGCEL